MGAMRPFALGLLLATGACVEGLEVLEPLDAPSQDGGAAGVDVPDAGPVMVEVLQVSAGRQTTLALATDGIYGWGFGAFGLFDAVTSTLAQPTLLFSGGFISVASGEHFACLQDLEQRLNCWGDNVDAQLGTESATVFATPIPAPVGPVSSYGLGFDHVCAVVEGALQCWGRNDEGQLGRNDGLDTSSRPMPEPVAEPGPWRSVSAADGHTCAIKQDGSLWCWGRNTSNQLGQGAGSGDQLRDPVRVGTSSDWEVVAASQSHTCGIRGQDLYCWGGNGSGQLGLGDERERAVPELVESGYQDVQVSAFITCGLRLDGVVRCWGRNVEGQLGRDLRSTVPVEPEGIDFGVRQVDVGRFHTCLLGDDGGVRCTGQNTSFQVGVMNTARVDRFSLVF